MEQSAFAPPAAPILDQPAEVKPSRLSHHFWPLLAVLVLFAGAVSAGTIFIWQSVHHSTIDFFWKPVFDSSNPVLFCIADQDEYTAIMLRDAANPSQETVLKDNLSVVVIDDLYPVVDIARILQSHGKKYSFKGEGVTSMSDLQNGPTIFVCF